MRQIDRPHGPQGKVDTFETFLLQIFQGKVLPEPHAEPQVQVELQDPVHLPFVDIFRQPVLRRVDSRCSSPEIPALEDRHVKAEELQVKGRRKTRGARPYHSDLAPERFRSLVQLPAIEIVGPVRHVVYEPLESTDSNLFPVLAAVALLFAGVMADPADGSRKGAYGFYQFQRLEVLSGRGKMNVV